MPNQEIQLNDDERRLLSLSKAGQVLVAELLYPGCIKEVSLNTSINSKGLIDSSAIVCPFIFSGDHLKVRKKSEDLHVDSIPFLAIDIAGQEAIRLEESELAEALDMSENYSFNFMLSAFYYHYGIKYGRGTKRKESNKLQDKAFVSFFAYQMLLENRDLLNKLSKLIATGKVVSRKEISLLIKEVGLSYKATETYAYMMEYYSSNPHEFHKTRDAILKATTEEY